MAADISYWLQSVSNRVPGATKEIIDDAIRSSARKFCSDTHLYVRQLTAINIVALTPTYTLTAPSDTAIVDVEHVEINDKPIGAVSEDLLNKSNENWRTQESTEPTQIMVDPEKVLRLKQIPTEDITGGLKVWVSLKPNPTTTVIPDFIYDDWFDCVLNGALSKLLKQPNQVWTNIQLGNFYENEYDGEMTKARGKRITGKTSVRLRVQQPPFRIY